MRAGTLTSTTRDMAQPSPQSRGRTRKPYVALLRLALLSLIAPLVISCGTNLPGSVLGGECKVFERRQYVVLGKRRYDQNWIDGNVEAGVASCGWQRPGKRPATLDGAAPAPAAPVKRPGLIKRAVARVLHQPVPEPAPRPVDATPAPIETHDNIVHPPTPTVQQAAPVKSPLDELLEPSTPAPREPVRKPKRCRLWFLC